jgi:hypothetical protein
MNESKGNNPKFGSIPDNLQICPAKLEGGRT